MKRGNFGFWKFLISVALGVAGTLAYQNWTAVTEWFTKIFS